MRYTASNQIAAPQPTPPGHPRRPANALPAPSLLSRSTTCSRLRTTGTNRPYHGTNRRQPPLSRHQPPPTTVIAAPTVTNRPYRGTSRHLLPPAFCPPNWPSHLGRPAAPPRPLSSRFAPPPLWSPPPLHRRDRLLPPMLGLSATSLPCCLASRARCPRAASPSVVERWPGQALHALPLPPHTHQGACTQPNDSRLWCGRPSTTLPYPCPPAPPPPPASAPVPADEPTIRMLKSWLLLSSLLPL
jgi:hypothetical protein